MAERKLEIQGLRAIAVSSVLLFHIWPDLVPGGYVGVDVFFVISGYLITGLLIREAETSGRISLLNFYERRIRRLLPAATLVLVSVTLFIGLLPEARWEETAYELIASALYVENWHLSRLAVDYLGAENAPSPVQHYWSLSIEEQFYIVWPAIVIAILGTGRSSNFRRLLLLSLGVISLGSLAASIVLTARNPQAAYFVTHTRVWELALGGALAAAVLPAISAPVRETMRLLGLAAILVACFAFTRTTPFPGYAALLPTIGCALVIAAGKNEGRWSSFRILALRPAQYLGDISYSVYLWHWPLVVFGLVLLESSYLSHSGVLILAATIVLADFSKRFIEDPFRRPGAATRTLASGAALVAVSVIAAGFVIFTVGSKAPGTAIAQTADLYPGARALLEGIQPEAAEPIPPAALIRKDIPEAYSEGCHRGAKDVDLNPCRFGPKEGSFRVILTGDSHAANWIPAFEQLALTRGWWVETHTKSGCPLLVEVTVLRDGPYEACKAWGELVLEHIARTKPDVVVMAQSAGVRMFDKGLTVEETLVKTWRQIAESGVKVVAIADTPRHAVNPAECIEKDPACASPREAVMRDDPILAAQRRNTGVGLIDMNDAFCTATSCPMIIGNVVAWRDKHHFTATYSRTLATALGERIKAAVGNVPVLPTFSN